MNAGGAHEDGWFEPGQYVRSSGMMDWWPDVHPLAGSATAPVARLDRVRDISVEYRVDHPSPDSIAHVELQVVGEKDGDLLESASVGLFLCNLVGTLLAIPLVAWCAVSVRARSRTPRSPAAEIPVEAT